MVLKFEVNETVVKVALIAFNFIFSILSLALLALGIVYIDDLELPKRYIGLEFVEVPTLLIILGSLSFIASLIGCYCARNDNHRMMKFFILFLSILLALELAISIISFLNVNDNLSTKTRRIMKSQLLSDDYSIRHEVYDIEEFFGCCGINGAADYLQEEFRAESCCRDKNGSCTMELIKEYELDDIPGCAQVLVDMIMHIGMQVGTYTAVCTCLQILEIICLCLMSVKE